MVHVNTTTCYDLICCDGRWYCQDVLVLYYNHQLLAYYMADVIAMWQMEWPLQGGSVGRCYCHVADGMATGSVYFKFYSVIGTLHHRAKAICTNPKLLKQEDHLYRAVKKCKHPAWALNRIKIKSRSQNQKKNSNNQRNTGNDIIQKPHIVVPYHRGLSESFRKVCSNHGVQVYFKGGTTIKNLLMAP